MRRICDRAPIVQMRNTQSPRLPFVTSYANTSSRSRRLPHAASRRSIALVVVRTHSQCERTSIVRFRRQSESSIKFKILVVCPTTFPLHLDPRTNPGEDRTPIRLHQSWSVSYANTTPSSHASLPRSVLPRGAPDANPPHPLADIGTPMPLSILTGSQPRRLKVKSAREHVRPSWPDGACGGTSESVPRRSLRRSPCRSASRRGSNP